MKKIVLFICGKLWIVLCAISLVMATYYWIEFFKVDKLLDAKNAEGIVDWALVAKSNEIAGKAWLCLVPILFARISAAIFNKE